VCLIIGSISARIVNRPQMHPAYNASKAAVHQLITSLAAAWAPYNVRVNALAAWLRQDGHGAGRPP
jgi:NAD(P)-dependent dehydrogenase (short-subunit alcohol dehydrogenase family)